MAEKIRKDIMLKVLDTLNESQACWFTGMQAMMLGHGGIKKMSEVTGLSRPTIIKGIKELKTKRKLDAGEKIRQPGAGRKRINALGLPSSINIDAGERKKVPTL